jgi:hypothetical protein
MNEYIKKLMEMGFKPETAYKEKREITLALKEMGVTHIVKISEIMLEFMWTDATEEDYEATRRYNEEMAYEDEMRA